jgi:hypothetical protein
MRIEMIAKSLRGIAAAFVIGTASVAVASVASVSVAQAAGVRAEVGKPLQQALKLAKEGKGPAAMAEIRKAESVKKLTAYERKTIAQMKQYVMVTTGDFSGGVTNATIAKAKFAHDLRARRYHDVVTTDAQLLKKFGVYDFRSQYIVAQAYYQMRQYRTAYDLLKGMGNSDQVIKLRMASASKLGDNAAVSQAAEDLVLKGKKEFWQFLFAAADNTRGLKDEESLGIFRVRVLTDRMRNGDDYSNATQLAILLNYPQEAARIQEAGFKAKVLSGTRQQRLLARARQSAAQQEKQMAALASQAYAAKTGDPLVKLAETYWGIGQYKEALDAAKAGLKKGVKDSDQAQMVLGMAYAGLREHGQAVRAFHRIRGAKAKVVARLWSVYARTR